VADVDPSPERAGDRAFELGTKPIDVDEERRDQRRSQHEAERRCRSDQQFFSSHIASLHRLTASRPLSLVSRKHIGPRLLNPSLPREYF
jgi:hypothetical protein